MIWNIYSWITWAMWTGTESCLNTHDFPLITPLILGLITVQHLDVGGGIDSQVLREEIEGITRPSLLTTPSNFKDDMNLIIMRTSVLPQCVWDGSASVSMDHMIHPDFEYRLPSLHHSYLMSCCITPYCWDRGYVLDLLGKFNCPYDIWLPIITCDRQEPPAGY